jgi:hypothetical protein
MSYLPIYNPDITHLVLLNVRVLHSVNSENKRKLPYNNYFLQEKT